MMDSMSEHPYEELIPDVILTALENLGLPCSGQFLALNSYENRVYQIGLDDKAPVIVKFYRPERWSTEAILEEHEFVQTLVEHEIPVVAPIAYDGETLLSWKQFRFAVYPRKGGRWPNLEDPDNLMWMGRFIARIHAIGATRPFAHRPTLNIEAFGLQPAKFLLEHNLIPSHLVAAYESLTRDLFIQIEAAYARAGEIANIRLHGDCHPGNILWTDDGPHFVDFDDCRMGPAIQDLWMLLSGDRQEQSIQLSEIVEGYNEFHDFDSRQLNLVEALRTLRMVHYAYWLAQRWTDPAFPQAFPWFGNDRYWEEHILSLREQAAMLNEPVLNI